MKSLNKIKTLDIINKFGTKTKCYLTGTPIDLEKDNYCFDYIVPVSKGGTNDLSNLGITIPIANYSKSDLTVEEYLELCKKVLEHYSPYKIKYEQYFVMYSDRLKRRYYQEKRWAEAGPYTA